MSLCFPLPGPLLGFEIGALFGLAILLTLAAFFFQGAILGNFPARYAAATFILALLPGLGLTGAYLIFVFATLAAIYFSLQFLRNRNAST